MRISVIIPTYNRAELLEKTLRAYVEQSGDHQICEVLVVDDGSRDHTAAVVEEWSKNPTLSVRYLKQENHGIASARNHAIRKAKGELLLFGDDDVIPGCDMVAHHVAWHDRHPEPNAGLLGLVTWAPEVNATPFMVWSGLYGPQFNFGYFAEDLELDFRHAYFCNTSVKASFLAQNGVFDETFRQYGWEDIELGYRLCTKGYRLLYSSEAVGYHYKFETFENARQRIETLYSTWPVFAKTEAGKRFLELWQVQTAASVTFAEAIVKTLARPLKVAAMPLLRVLADTRIPLPHRLYDMVFYHYVAPFSSFLNNSDEQVKN
jgi:GT2 family glycosyltransferase